MITHLPSSSESVYGFSGGGRKDTTWHSFCQNQQLYIINFPLDSNDHEVSLGDFASMPNESLNAWRDHLLDSFSENSDSKRPLRFRRLDGSRIQLSALRMGSQSPVKPNKKIRSKGVGKKKSATNQKRGRKKKVKSSREIEEEEEEEISMESFSSTTSELNGEGWTTPPPRDAIPRAASAKARKSLTKILSQRLPPDPIEVKKRKNARVLPANAPKPGSEEQRVRAAARRASLASSAGERFSVGGNGDVFSVASVDQSVAGHVDENDGGMQANSKNQGSISADFDDGRSASLKRSGKNKRQKPVDSCSNESDREEQDTGILYDRSIDLALRAPSKWRKPGLSINSVRHVIFNIFISISRNHL
jgi:hypothetical protein